MPDPRLVERVAAAPGARPSLVEKDWHIVRALGVLVRLDHGAVRPALSGGTSLSMAWGLLKRFSEDVDFKVALSAATSGSNARTQRRDYCEKLLTALAAADFTPMGTPQVGHESQFFTVNFFSCPSEFLAEPGLWPHLRVEVSFEATAFPIGRA